MTLLVPRPHQRAATRAILDARAAGQPGFLLGDMTGLGKTLSVWAAVATMPEREILIVCPKGAIPQWRRTIAVTLAAEDAVARLDERLATSAIREGWIARTHFSDACACVWADGDLVMPEDLVLHDAARDVRTPSHELVRAQDFLRTRRRIAAAPPGWALTAAGLLSLRGVPHPSGVRAADPPPAPQQGSGRLESDAIAIEDDALFAEIDALIARSSKVLAGERVASPPPAPRDPLVYEEAFDEEGRLETWLALAADTQNLPPVFAAAIAADAWDRMTPLEHMGWLGRMLVPDLLRVREKTKSHLLCLNTGLKTVPRERRRSRDRDVRILAWLAAIREAAELGLRDHDRWTLSRESLRRRLIGRRSTSSLPALIELVMRRPIVSAGLIAAELKITPRAAQTLVRELGLREATGRGRYRAWVFCDL